MKGASSALKVLTAVRKELQGSERPPAVTWDVPSCRAPSLAGPVGLQSAQEKRVQPPRASPTAFRISVYSMPTASS